MDGSRKRQAQQDPSDFTPRRKINGQRPVDQFSSIINYVKTRPYESWKHAHQRHVPPHPYYCKDLLPPKYTASNPSTALCTQWVHTLFHMESKMSGGARGRRVNFTALQYAPTGRRLLCATSQGEFLLYNGNAFGMEMRTVAHDEPIRGLSWGGVNDIILSSDDGGTIKLWLSSFNSVAKFDSQQRAVREVGWSPGEHKFCTGGQDGSVRIWDTDRAGSGAAEAEHKLEGHGGDIHSIHWHPTKALVLSGSQDRDARMWDPRKGSGGLVATMQGHSAPVTRVRWNHSGTLVATGSRDATVRLWDIRMAKELAVLQGHTKDVLALEWHPFMDTLLATTGADGNIVYWDARFEGGNVKPDGVYEVKKWAASIPLAHDEYRGTPNMIGDLKWSPMGHMLVSASSEVKFWTRNKPGAVEEIRGTVDKADIVVNQQ